MTDLEALLAAVLDEPEADAPRLVYADALEETGKEANVARAELIRLQLAGEDGVRQQKLLETWLGDWLPMSIRHRCNLSVSPDGVCRLAGLRGQKLEIERGFVTALSCQIEPYFGHSLAWTETTPGILADDFDGTLDVLFAENPIERLVLDLGQREEWRIERNARWECVNETASKPILCESATREKFRPRLQSGIRQRLLVLGRQILWQQRVVRLPSVRDPAN